MPGRLGAAALFLVLLLHGCLGSPPPPRLQYTATGSSPRLLAVYEGWFGEPSHLNVGYSSHDTHTLRDQIENAKGMGISAFVVDWYGDRDPFVDQTYALMEKQAAKNHFHVAVMYDESNAVDGATDAAIADLTMFRDSYLATKEGREAYLTYQGRPVIFVWPRGNAVDWDKVRVVLNQWNPAPWLIDENVPGQYAKDFDGFYPWINPGPKGWAADGSHWGQGYLTSFYQTMAQKYPDKIIVGGAWAEFNDSRASWGLNRHISARCGQTFRDTLNLWQKYVPAGQVVPFLMVETWNDWEEGTAIEKGLPTCGGGPAPTSVVSEETVAEK
jgi:hypothetical protein